MEYDQGAQDLPVPRPGFANDLINEEGLQSSHNAVGRAEPLAITGIIRCGHAVQASVSNITTQRNLLQALS